MSTRPPLMAEESLAFLKSLAEASAIFVAFTYIAGWSYLAAYYSAFGVNPLELELPLPVVCTTAVYVLFNVGWWRLLAAIVLIFLLGLMVFVHRWKGMWRSATAAALAALLSAASAAGVLFGQRQAREDMLVDSSELPYVAFSSRLEKTDQPPCVDHQTYGSLDCKLLLHSKGTYYFFTPVPKPDDTLTSVGSLNLYTLADSDVTGVHILRGLARNVEGR